MKASPHLHVVLLAGGRGTRAWPLSRRRRPKQLLDLTGEGPLVAATLERVAPLCPPERTLAVTSGDLAPAVRRATGLPAGNVLVEPDARNTAPAVALAAMVAAARDPQAVLLALPADHHVEDADALRRALAAGSRAAARLRGTVIFGARPDRPHEGYGYIVPGEPLALKGVDDLVRVRRFVEKPSERQAARLVREGALWNSGMFCLHAASVLDEVSRLLPALGEVLQSVRPHVDRKSFRRALREAWEAVPAISFDHGVLEKSDAVHALPLDAGWSDVGSWESLARLAEAEPNDNRRRGSALFHEASDCVVLQGSSSKRRTVVVAGVEGLVVVDAGDALLVCPREGVPDLETLLERVRDERPDLA